MKITKLLTSVAALALVLSLGACEGTTKEETSEDTAEDYVEPESVTDYTVSFSFTEDGKATTIPSYATAYIVGDWDEWKEFLPLEQTGAATYSYTFDEISTGTHEYKGVMQYTYKEVSWDCAQIITNDEGDNASFTISGLDQGSKSITEELRVAYLASYQNPDEFFSGVAKTHNYKGTYADITYTSTTGVTYGAYKEDESVLQSEEILASLEVSSYAYYEGYFTDDVVVIKITSDYGYGPSSSYYIYLNSDDSDSYYIFADYGYGGGWTSYYGSPFQQKWNDNYNSLFWASTYSNIYFKFDHDELINDEYVAVYSQSQESSNLYFQVFGVDALMQSQYSASYLAGVFSHAYSYFFPEEEKLVADYYCEPTIYWDWQDGYNSDYTGPSSEDATVYLQSEEGLLIADEIGSIDEDAIKAYATEVYNTIYSGAAG